MSEVACRGWRLVCAPPGFSALGLGQHSSAAEAAAAVVARSLEQLAEGKSHASSEDARGEELDEV